MAASIQHLSASASEADLLRVMAEDGAVIVDDMIDPAQVADLSGELTSFLGSGSVGRDEFTGFYTKRIGALMARSPACGELALHPTLLSAARAFLADHCADIQLHFTSAVSIGPGESDQILHRDRGIWGGYLPRQVEPLFSTIWALTPFTRQNGATRVVPGSQHWEKRREPEPHEIAYA